MVPSARILVTALAIGTFTLATASTGQQSGMPLIWGWNSTGQLADAPVIQRSAPFQVPGVDSLRSIAAGVTFAVARRSDGTVWVWGTNSAGWLDGEPGQFLPSPTQVAGLSGVVDIAAGRFHGLALLVDGTVRAWGNNSSGQLGTGGTGGGSAPVLVAGLDEVVAIAAGWRTSYAVRTDGTVWAWGRGGSGQLGNGTAVSSPTPVQVTGLSHVVGVAAGDQHAVAVKDDGTVWAWGANGLGQVGDGTGVNRLVPVQVADVVGAVQVAAGGYASFALLADGTIRSWGRNMAGQLGDGTLDNRNAPVAVVGLTSVTGIAGGETHALARRADGTVWAWGEDMWGACGDRFTRHSAPVAMSGTPSITAIAAGSRFSLGLAVDGTAWAWGTNADAEHGDGRALHSALPRSVSGLPATAALALGEFHDLAVDTDDRLWSWGVGDLGQTGHGAQEYPSPPALVAGIGAVVSAATGLEHSLAAAADGTVWAWGDNSQWQLAHPSQGDLQLQPWQVQSLGGAVAVAAGDYHSVVLKDDGTVWAWGDNSGGQLGDGTFEDRSEPVQALGVSGVTAVASTVRGYHTLALRDDGTVWAWGRNGSGQLGNGSTENLATPIQVPGLTGMVRIAVGGFGSSYALGADGRLWAWGENGNGQLGDGTTTRRITPAVVPGLAGVVSVAAGDTHAVALTADGQVWAWGFNYAGQLGLDDLQDRWLPTPVPGLSGVLEVFAGGDNTAVIAVCELGCSATAPVAGEPMEVLQLAAAATMTSGCVAAPTFDWDFGDGSAHSSEQVADHWYEAEGTFHWVLTVTTEGQTCTQEGDITIAYPCTVACSASAPSYVQAATPAVFVGSATPNHCAAGATTDWDFGDGSAHSSDHSPSHSYTVPGVYTWTLTATANGASCVRTGTITVLGAACTGAYDLIVPAAAHSNNAWQSDLDLYNVGADPASVDIALLKPGQANLNPAAMNVAVLPFQTLRIPDILGSLLPAANAALGIRFCSGSALVNSRFYNIGTAKTGTFGAIVPALPPTAAVAPSTRGVFHHLTYSTDPKAGYRVNLGFANASPFSVSVTVRLFGDDGSLIGTKTLSVRAFEQSRLDKIHQTLGTGPVAHGAMTVEVNTPGALLHAYALLIDNVSNDPAFMPVELVPK